MRRKVNKFTLLVWLLAAAAIVWLCISPVVMNIVAEKTWKRVPCVVVLDKGQDLERYFYIENNIRHSNFRRDFWEPGPGESIQSRNLELPEGKNRSCYMNPYNSSDTVLYLTGLFDLSRSGKALGKSLILIVTCFILTVISARRAKNKGGSVI